jgi:hypothetical protein
MSALRRCHRQGATYRGVCWEAETNGTCRMSIVRHIPGGFHFLRYQDNPSHTTACSTMEGCTQ